MAPTGIGNSQLRGPASLDLHESKQSDIPVDSFRAEFEWLAPLGTCPPREYGPVYALLASRQNRIITGQTVVADSGTSTVPS